MDERTEVREEGYSSIPEGLIGLYDTAQYAFAMRTSYSRLDVYKSCPRKFKLLHLEKAVELPSEALLVGKAVHSALETWVAVEGHDVGDLLDIFSVACDVQRESGHISEEEEELARVMLYDFYSKLEVLDKGLIVGVEHQFELYTSGVKIVGVIDRASYTDDSKKVLLISDYKSGRSSITQAQAKNNLQMAIYTMAAMQDFKAERYITELIYPRLNKSIKHEFTEDELAVHREDIRTTALDIKLDKRFKPTGTPPKCGYCGFNTICGTGKFQNKIWQGIVKKREANKK